MLDDKIINTITHINFEDDESDVSESDIDSFDIEFDESTGDAEWQKS